MISETLISICLGVGLSAAVGFRVFVPLFVLSLASYFDVWQINDSWEWIGNLSAVIILGVATLVEIVAYYLPYVDNLLDTIAIPMATLAGTVVMVATVANLSPEVTWALAIIAGGGTATAIATSTGTTRLASTVSTGGLGNNLVSTSETGASIAVAGLSVVLPYLAICLVILILVFVFIFHKKIFKANK